MPEKMKFDYYYGSDAEQFTFIRLPKMLFTEERFKKLSSDAKILFGIMLDRMSLSVKNQWIDEENRVYIIFTLENVMEVFSCSERKASYLMKELDTKSGIGLIEKKRQGLGKPNLIYVKNFLVKNNPTTMDKNEEEKIVNETGNHGQLLSCNSVQIQECNSVQVQNSKTMQVKSGTDVQTNNTDYNKTDLSETIYPSSEKALPRDGVEKDTMDGIEQYRRIIKNNIEYDLLREKLSIGECDYLDEILELMVETICVNCEKIRIESKEIPYQLVKARLLKINCMHVEYVINCLQQTTNKIRNIKAYLLTMLYNAPATINSYYCAEINYDMQNGYTE